MHERYHVSQRVNNKDTCLHGPSALSNLELRAVGRPDSEVRQPEQVEVEGVAGLDVAEQAVFFESTPRAVSEHSQHAAVFCWMLSSTEAEAQGKACKSVNIWNTFVHVAVNFIDNRMCANDALIVRVKNLFRSHPFVTPKSGAVRRRRITCFPPLRVDNTINRTSLFVLTTNTVCGTA